MGGAALLTGCFTGSFLAGRPCTDDDACGPALRCEDGYCGGADPLVTTGGSSGPPTPTGGGSTTTSISTAPTSSEVATASTSADGGSTTLVPAATTETGADSSSEAATTQAPDPCAASTCRKIDLLFVIDNSPSIAQWQGPLLQALLSLNLGAVGDLVKDSCDAHVGAITTGTPYAHNPPTCQGSGVLVRAGAGGSECVEGRPYATQDDDIGAALGCMVLVGTDGPGDERPIQALLRAISDPLNDPGGCNDGFFRADSVLVVVLITDEDDDADDGELPDQQTPGTAQEWYDQIVGFKGDPDLVVMTALVGDITDPPPCPWVPDASDGQGTEAPERLLPFLELFPRRAIGSLCTDDYGDFIKGPMYTQIVDACAAHAADSRGP